MASIMEQKRLGDLERFHELVHEVAENADIAEKALENIVRGKTINAGYHIGALRLRCTASYSAQLPRIIDKRICGAW